VARRPRKLRVHDTLNRCVEDTSTLQIPSPRSQHAETGDNGTCSRVDASELMPQAALVLPWVPSGHEPCRRTLKHSLTDEGSDDDRRGILHFGSAPLRVAARLQA
jgi:hypothetical protein